MLPTDIILFLQSISYIYKDKNNGWVEIFCPYCDDSTRRSGRLSHGHFSISTTFNFCRCFRCDYTGSLNRTLISLGFNNKESLSLISKNNSNNFQYYNNRISTNNNKIEHIYTHLETYYQQFMESNPLQFSQFLEYIYHRCLSIDPIKFLIKPVIMDNRYLLAGFYNINGQEVTYRYITNHPKFRYYIPKSKVKPYYFFQDIYNLGNYKNIVISEGAFDLINTYKYTTTFDDAFYIAIGGKQFRKIIKELLVNYLLIGSYIFNIILDNDVDFKPMKLVDGCKDIIYQLNPYCKINFYIPIYSKDVSELVNLEKLC